MVLLIASGAQASAPDGSVLFGGVTPRLRANSKDSLRDSFDGASLGASLSTDGGETSFDPMHHSEEASQGL